MLPEQRAQHVPWLFFHRVCAGWSLLLSVQNYSSRGEPKRKGRRHDACSPLAVRESRRLRKSSCLIWRSSCWERSSTPWWVAAPLRTIKDSHHCPDEDVSNDFVRNLPITQDTPLDGQRTFVSFQTSSADMIQYPRGRRNEAIGACFCICHIDLLVR